MSLADRLRAARAAEAKHGATADACRRRFATIDADFDSAAMAVKATKIAFADMSVRHSIGEATADDLEAAHSAHVEAVQRYDRAVAERAALDEVKRQAESAANRADIEARECRRLASLEILDGGLADRLRVDARKFLATLSEYCGVAIAGHHARGDALFQLGMNEDEQSLPGLARAAGVALRFENRPYATEPRLLSDEQLIAMLERTKK